MQISFKKLLYLFIFVMLLSLGYQAFAEAEKKNRHPLEVNFLDVGQGDSILIDYLSHYQILIDAGKDGNRTLKEVEKLMPPGDNKIDIIVATHPDMDHIGGMPKVLDHFDAGLFLDNGFDDKGGAQEKMNSKLESKGISRRAVFEGSKIDLGKHLKIEVYNPDNRNYNKNDKNGDSVVLRMDFGENSFLFTGDITEKTERDILNDEEDIDTDWLKVAHHGSKSSSSEEFIEEVDPEYSIISVGENSYGHPHPDAVEVLDNLSGEVLTTRQEGTIRAGCPGIDQNCFILGRSKN
ncbi:MAG: ComEC/Rec2 family competence protein [Patescibacteria group bacterium]